MPPILGQPHGSREPREADSGKQDASLVTLAIQFPGTELGAAGAAGSLKRLAGWSETIRHARAYSSVG
jgi:hypothetical protein